MILTKQKQISHDLAMVQLHFISSIFYYKGRKKSQHINNITTSQKWGCPMRSINVGRSWRRWIYRQKRNSQTPPCRDAGITSAGPLSCKRDGGVLNLQKNWHLLKIYIRARAISTTKSESEPSSLLINGLVLFVLKKTDKNRFACPNPPTQMGR